MKHLIYIFIMVGIMSGNAQITEDKIAHYTWSMLAGVPTYYIYYDVADMHPVLAITATTGTAALASWGFEHYQKSTGRGVYDNRDILASATGAFTGAIFAELIRHKPEKYKARQLRKQKKREERYRRWQKKQ